MSKQWSDERAEWEHVGYNVWTERRPSRRLLKLYREIDHLQRRIEEVWHTVFVPDHGPSDYVARCAELRPLYRERERLMVQIDRLQNS